MISDKDNFDWQKYITECLESTEYCALATVDKEFGVWSNPVWFAWDDDYNFYFISQPHSRHMQNLIKNQQSSISIYKTGFAYTDEKFGVQLVGEAVILPDSEIDKAYGIYYGRKYPKTRRNKSGKVEKDYYGKNAEWKFVKVTPTQIYYFDSKVFGEERQEVPMGEITIMKTP